MSVTLCKMFVTGQTNLSYLPWSGSTLTLVALGADAIAPMMLVATVPCPSAPTRLLLPLPFPPRPLLPPSPPLPLPLVFTPVTAAVAAAAVADAAAAAAAEDSADTLGWRRMTRPGEWCRSLVRPMRLVRCGDAFERRSICA